MARCETLVDVATAIPTAREAYLLALQVQRLHHFLKSPKSAQRNRAV